MLLSRKQQGFVILAAVISLSLAVSEITQHVDATRPPPSRKPRLYSLYESHDGLILICIGINEHNNFTWFWRDENDNEVEPVVKGENNVFIHKLNYWMVFRNRLQSTSRLELRGSMKVYNNTYFICSKDGVKMEYKFVLKNPTDDGNIPKKWEAASTPDYSKTRPSHGFNTRPPLTSHDLKGTTLRIKNEQYPQIIRLSRHSFYVGDRLSLECAYTSHDSSVAWNLEYSTSKRDVYLSQTDVDFRKNQTMFFSKLIIHPLQPEHNNTKVICENEEGHDEYYISLTQRKRLYEPCESNNDCQDANARCKYGFCTCTQRYAYEQNYNGLDICLKRKKYNEECDYSSQCGKMKSNMMCEGYRCKCLRGYTFNGYGCTIQKRNLGELCYLDDNCAFTYGKCRNISNSFKVCECQDGFKQTGTKCISRHLQVEEHMFAIGFLTAVIILATLAVALILFALRSARVCYMQRKGRHYREVIMGEQQLSISSRLARFTPSKVDIIAQEKVDSPCGPSDVFTTIHLTPCPGKREMKPAEDKTVCVPETIPFIHTSHSSSC